MKIRILLSIVIFGAALCVFWSEQKNNDNEEFFFVTLSKDNAKRLGFTHKILHNLFYTGYQTEITQSVIAKNGSCQAAIGEPDGVYALKIEVFEPPKVGLEDLNARIGITGEVLLYNEPEASALIAKKVNKAYSAIMNCYKAQMSQRSLLETMQ